MLNRIEKCGGVGHAMQPFSRHIIIIKIIVITKDNEPLNHRIEWPS